MKSSAGCAVLGISATLSVVWQGVAMLNTWFYMIIWHVFNSCSTCLTSLLIWARVAPNTKIARFTLLSRQNFMRVYLYTNTCAGKRRDACRWQSQAILKEMWTLDPWCPLNASFQLRNLPEVALSVIDNNYVMPCSTVHTCKLHQAETDLDVVVLPNKGLAWPCLLLWAMFWYDNAPIGTL